MIIMWPLYKILFVTFHILFLPVTLFVLLLLYIYKHAVCFCASRFCKFEGPVPSSSCVFLPDKLWEQPHSTNVVVLELEGPCTLAKIANLFEEAYRKRDNTGERYYKELAYYPVFYLGYPFWQKASHFKITKRFHLLKCTSAKSEADVITKMVEDLQCKPFERKQPLWDVYLVPEICGNSKKSLMFFRFHHLLCDGMSLLKFFYVLTGSSDLPKTFTKPDQSFKKWRYISQSNFTKVGTIFKLAIVGFGEYLHDVLWDTDHNPLNFDALGLPKITGNWICSVSNTLEIDNLKKASKSFNCSLVHLILCAVSNGLEQYIQKYHDDQPKPHGLFYMCGLPIPGHPAMKFVNYFCLGKIRAKFGIQDIADKIDYYKKESEKCALSNMPLVSTFMFQYLVRIFPEFVLERFTTTKVTSTVMLSNVVGPQDKNRLFAGAEVKSLMNFQPIPHKSMALSVGTVSGNGSMRICLKADVGCIENRNRLEDLTQMIEQEFVKFCHEAEKTA